MSQEQHKEQHEKHPEERPEEPKQVTWERLEELNERARKLGLVGYCCEEGRVVVDTMAIRVSKKLRRFCLITDSSSQKVRALERCGRCTVYVGNILTAMHAVCFTRVRIVRQGEDPELFRELWTEHCKNWLSGPEDPRMCVLVLEIEEAWMRNDCPACGHRGGACRDSCCAGCPGDGPGTCPEARRFRGADHPCGGDEGCPCRAECEKECRAAGQAK